VRTITITASASSAAEREVRPVQIPAQPDRRDPGPEVILQPLDAAGEIARRGHPHLAGQVTPPGVDASV